MTEDQALARLERMLAADVDPILSADEMSDLLDLAKREDSAGLAPSEDDWEPTFDLDYAAAEGWRWKAGRTVPRYGVTLDTESLQRQQVYAHCISQANHYAKRIIGNIGVLPSTTPVEEESFQ